MRIIKLKWKAHWNRYISTKCTKLSLLIRRHCLNWSTITGWWHQNDSRNILTFAAINIHTSYESILWKVFVYVHSAWIHMSVHSHVWSKKKGNLHNNFKWQLHAIHRTPVNRGRHRCIGNSIDEENHSICFIIIKYHKIHFSCNIEKKVCSFNFEWNNVNNTVWYAKDSYAH